MSAVKITVFNNGPLRVEPADAIDLVDGAGNKFNLAGKPGVSLCRCGHSANKPFCDGAHKTSGFQASEPAR